MDNVIDKLREVETLCEEIRSEADDLEHSASEVEGYAQELKREARVVRDKANDAECLLEELKQFVGKAKRIGPKQAMTPIDAEAQGFAVFRQPGFNMHYCIDLPQEEYGEEWAVVSIKMGDILMTIGALPISHGSRVWEPGDGWRGADVKIHGPQSVIVHSKAPFELTSKSSRNSVNVDGTVGVTAILAPDKQ